MSRHHVLIIPSWYPTVKKPLNGIFFKEQAIALKRQGNKVGIIYPELRSIRTLFQKDMGKFLFGEMSTHEENGLLTIRSYNFSPPKMRKSSAKLWIRKAQQLTEYYISKFGKPDIIHAHSVLWGGVAAKEISEKLGILYLITEHSSAYARNLIQEWQIPKIKMALDSANRIIAVSKGLASSLRKFTSKPIDVVPNIVNTDFFHLPERQKETHPFRFLTVAMLTKEKAIDILIRAFAKAFQNQNNVILEIGGDGEERENLENLAVNLEIREHVNFLGMLSRERVREAMWRANVFVLPSYIETFGVVFIEAMSTGLPVIATKCGGPEDFVISKVGYLLKPGNIDELSEALKDSYEKYEKWHKNALNIRKYTIERFSEKAIVSELNAIYDRTKGRNI